MKKLPSNPVSSGVEDLISRLRDEGVAAGKEEAERIITEAKERARRIVADAEAEANSLRNTAREDVSRFKQAAEDEVKIAYRDTVLDLKERIVRRFNRDLSRLVTTKIHDEHMLKDLILEVAGRVRSDASLEREKRLEIVLPRGIVDLEDLQKNPEETEPGSLNHFVLAMARETLQDGVTFTVTDDPTKKGISVRLLEKDIEIDITDDAVSALLLEHIQPRFRAYMEGVIR